MPAMEDRGYFWWSGEKVEAGHFAPASAVSGTLTIKDDGTSRLELDGFLSPFNEGISGLFDSGTKVDRNIQGFLKNKNGQVLLSEVYKSGGRLSTQGASYESYLAFDCLVGQITGTTSEIDLTALDFVEVDLDGLEDWIGLGSIEAKETKTGSVTIKFKKKKPTTYKTGNEKIQLVYGLERPYLGIRDHNAIKIRETARLRVSGRQKFGLGEARNKFSSLHNLISLLAGLNIQLAWPRVGNSTKKLTYTLYSRGLQPTSMQDSISRQKCWFPYTAISQDFGSLYETWRSKSEEFGPGFYLCLGAKRQTTIYVESRFGNLISGLESFHRTKFPDQKNAGLSAKIARILESAIPKDRPWLKNRLAYADETSLADRIGEIVGGFASRS